MSFLATVAATVAANEIFGGGGGGDIASAITGGIGGGVGSAVSDIESLFSGATSNLISLFDNGFSGFLDTAGGVLGSIDKTVNEVANTIDAVISPISKVIDDITQIARDINDKLVVPIATIITKTYDSINGVITAIHNDLKDGLAGLVKIPGDIADALTSVDAAWQRAVQQMGMNNQGIISELLIPAFTKIGSAPISELSDALSPKSEPVGESPLFAKHDKLLEENEITDFKASYEKLIAFLQKDHGLLTPLMQFMYYLWFAGPFLVGLMENKTELAKQVANMASPDTTLDPGTVIASLRRGLLSQADAAEELLRQGFDDTRQQVLLDVTQYLFSPSDANELYIRNAIDAATYYAIAAQNGMDQGQADAITALQAYMFSPGDLATLFARGIIDGPAYDNLMAQARLTPLQAEAVKELEITPIGPRTTIDFFHRDAARQGGFMQQTLSIPTPDAVAQAYDINQIDPAQAAADWMLHWDLHNADWWVQAYYRKLRTREECYAAFEEMAIPKELWDDEFIVRGELISAFILLEIIKTGVLTEEQGRLIMQQQGMLPEQIDIMIEYSKRAGKTTKAATAGDLQKLSLGTAATLYDDKAIDAPTYQQVLIDHGYTADAAALTIELADINNQQKERKAYAQNLVDQVTLGLLSRDNALSQLFAAGFSDTETAQYAAAIDKAKQANVKLPSRAELDAMYKKAIIDQATWTDTMLLLGYSQTWADNLFRLL